MKTMKSKFAGTCVKCHDQFPAGTEISWSRDTGAMHSYPCNSVSQTGWLTRNGVPYAPSLRNDKGHFDGAAQGFASTVGVRQHEKQSQSADSVEKLVPGVYEIDGQIYVVKYNRSKTNLYAKKLVELNGDYRTTEAGARVDFEFEYAKGAVYDLKLSDRMPLERAKELITLYGKCINCSRHLKAAKSVENGIGPVCIKSFGPVLNPVCETTDGRQIVRSA